MCIGTRARQRGVVLVAGIAAILLFAACRTAQPAPADPRMIDLAVRATVHALPTATPLVVEVTRMVEVEIKVEVEVTRIVEVTVTPTPTATPLPSATPEPAVQRAPVVAAVASQPETVPSSTCPDRSDRQYNAIPIVGAPASRPDHLHGDLNLALRGYEPADGELALKSINGPSAGDPPQLYHLFGDTRTPRFTALYRVRKWNWDCSESGCRGEALDQRSLVGMAVAPGEAIFAPLRSAEIYGGDFRALVLYADTERVTLGYTREDTVANGYAIHVEGLCVDANLLALYRLSNSNGRGELPALRPGDVIGAAARDEIAVAVRDRGAFLDPRSRKDWWRGR